MILYYTKSISLSKLNIIGVPQYIYTVENWEIYFGQDGTFSKSAKYKTFSYHIFINYDKVSDTCVKGYHNLKAIRDYLSPTNAINELNVDYNFELN